MSTFTNQSKNSATFTNQSKSTVGGGNLLLESGDSLLLESGDNLVLEGSGASAITWSNLTKN